MWLRASVLFHTIDAFLSTVGGTFLARSAFRWLEIPDYLPHEQS
jgi:hypothetical protein